ncbi:hypothetical protein BH11BAC2_BH11BAC2_00770 [soil metagenome]
MKADSINSEGQDEYTVKALFVYNFIKHIEWPAPKNQSSTFTISVLGNSEVTGKLEALLKGRKIFDKTFEIRVCNNLDETANSQIIYISKSQSEKISSLLEKLSGKGVLIIAEDRNMAARGACINIIQSNNHMRFELNESALKKEGLKISNQLLELATVVK